MTVEQIQAFLDRHNIAKDDYEAMNDAIYQIVLDNPQFVYPETKAQMKQHWERCRKASASGSYIHEIDWTNELMYIRSYVQGSGEYFEGNALRGNEVCAPFDIIQRMSTNISLDTFVDYFRK